jgi:AbiV family abortive infection protein
MTRRSYRNNLDFVAAAFQACWKTAQDHVEAAKVLMDSGHHAQALSISVLALEELGKLFCVDGLLFARSDDDRAKQFAKSLRSHATKLAALELFPLLLNNLSSVDPRNSEGRFAQAIAASALDLKARGTTVLEMSSGDGFHTLDSWKQKGFYSRPSDASFMKPSESVNPEMAEAVYRLAWRACSTLDFLLKDGNLQRYIDSAQTLRSKMTEEGHQELTARAEEIMTSIFPSDDENSEPTLH